MRSFLAGLLLLVGISTSIAAQQPVDTLSVDSTAVLRTTVLYSIDSTTVVDTAAWSFTIIIRDTTTVPTMPTPTAAPVAGVGPYTITLVDLRADSVILLVDWDEVPDATQYSIYAPGFSGPPMPFSEVVDFPLTEVNITVARQSVDWDLAIRVIPQNSFGSGPRTIVNFTVPMLGGTPTTPPPPPPPPSSPPTGASLFLDFNDGQNLGITCASSPLGGAQCPAWFTTGWRKHSYTATGGLNGSGAILMHWQTGMNIGFSPIWIETLYVPHFVLQYSVRQTAPMIHDGSAIKLLRVGTGSGMGNRIGTLESKNARAIWWWDDYMGNPESGWTMGNDPVGMLGGDNQWHTYRIEFDYRDPSNLIIVISFDGGPKWSVPGVRGGPVPSVGDLLIISPFAEMYSTGTAAGINTGDYVVDDFSFTILP